MSPSKKRIDPGPSSDGRVDAGRLSDVSVTELLAHARNTAFTGGLFFRPVPGERMTISFERGFIVGATGPWENGEVLQHTLLELLPAEQLRLAEAHAERQNLPLLAAVEHLSLLPPPTLSSAREGLIVQGIESLCWLPKQTRYAFVAQPAPAVSARGPQIDAIKVLLTCAMSELENGKARKCAEALANRTLQVTDSHLRGLLETLTGPARAVVSALSRPKTARELIEGRVASEAHVAAVLYGLWLTHHLAEGDTRPWSGPPKMDTDTHSSGTRRLTLPESLRPSAPSPSARGSLPPRDDKTSTWPPNSQLSSPPHRTTSAEAAARQSAMEKRVVEAWMASESDPGRTERAAEFARKAASVYPRNARIQFFAARLDVQTNRRSSAVKRFEQVLALEPTNDDARRELNLLRETMLPPARRGFSFKKLFGREKN